MSVPRVAVMHQGFVPHYRVRFFELLARRGGVEYVVVHGQPPSGIGHFAASGPFEFPNIEVSTRELRLAGKTVVVHDPRPVLRGRFDALVIGTHLLLVANHLLLAWFKARRRPVLLWGHGRERAEPGLKSRLARLADGYLAYTSGGKAWLASTGVDPARIAVVRNTLDMDVQIELHARLERVDEAVLRRELGFRPDSAVLLYVGRVYAEKRVPDLVEVVRRLRAGRLTDVPVELAIIGDGPSLGEVRAAAAGLKGVQILGEIREQDVVARYLRVASALVIPGAVGLSVNHALAHATPVVTRARAPHGPEIEFLEHGVNGLVVDGDLDALARELAQLIGSPARRQALEAGAQATRAALGLEEMIDAFDAAVRVALCRGGRAYPSGAAATAG